MVVENKKSRQLLKESEFIALLSIAGAENKESRNACVSLPCNGIHNCSGRTPALPYPLVSADIVLLRFVEQRKLLRFKKTVNHHPA